MGYYITQSDTNFKILKENLNDVLESIRALHGQETIRDGINQSRHHFSWVAENFYKKETLDEILDDWRYEVEYDNEGNVVNIEFTGEKLGDDEILFRQIAKFVEHDSYITICGEDGEQWRWVFENGQMNTKHRSNDFI